MGGLLETVCDDEGYSDEVEAVRFVLAVVTVEDTLEVDETIADAASNGNTLVAMAAAVEGGVGWIRRGFVAATVVVEALEVVLELVGSLPRRTWPPPTFLSSLGFEGATLSSSSHGQMASLVVALLGAGKAGSSAPSGGESLKSPWPVAP